jgi:protein-S-isoprenylcysteine O-methyltransferase Ste14
MIQLDAKTNVDIATATKDDGVAMKTIAVVTMLFLPATFVSSLLGTNFFNFNPDQHGGHMTYSHDLWIYFVVSVVLTLGLFTLWWAWQRMRQRKLASSRLEQTNAMERAYAVLQKP